MTDALYAVERECAVCGEKFQVTRVRSRLVMTKQDTDFCAHYKDVNPYYYTIWVCPHCGYAAQDSEFDKLSSSMKEKIQKFLSSREVNVDFSGARTREQAVVTYKLAAFYADMIESPASKLAGLYLRLGWLYREGEDAGEESAALSKAGEYYEQALSKERMPVGNMSELTVMYLVAELLRRAGNHEKAMRYLSMVVASPQAKLEKRIANLARDVWQEMRADAKIASVQE